MNDLPEQDEDKPQGAQPKILLLDIETSPVLAYVWALFDQNIALNQIEMDWHLLSWAAKWLREDHVFYMDQRNEPDMEDDKNILQGIWDLLDEADVIITQNGKRFDQKKLFSRFVIQGFKPPSSFRHIDTLQIAKRKFGFTSNKLEYMAEKLNKKYKKLKHEKFNGFELWRQCIAGNKEAWDEMEKYNKYDVLALEELWEKINPWDNSLNVNVYNDVDEVVCACGSMKFQRNGFHYSPSGRYQRFKCSKCGTEVRSRTNMLDKDKRKNIKINIK